MKNTPFVFVLSDSRSVVHINHDNVSTNLRARLDLFDSALRRCLLS